MMAVLCHIFGNIFMFSFTSEWTMSHHASFLQCHPKAWNQRGMSYFWYSAPVFVRNCGVTSGFSDFCPFGATCGF